MEHTASKELPGAVRRRRMLSLIREREFMRVSDLGRIFGISEVTVRSDLDHLASTSPIQRVHGGAIVLDGQVKAERSFEHSEVTAVDEKAAIGVAAAALVSSGDSLIIDVGSTTTAVARAVALRKDLEDIVIFTNGLTIAMELESEIPRFTVILTGGTLRRQQHSLVDPFAKVVLEQVHVTAAFIGCNGVHLDEGITNINLPEAAVKRSMVKAAERVVVVAEGSKLGRISMVRCAELSDVDVLITGRSAPSGLVDPIRDLGVTTTVAG
ncbi:MAG: DeoR/GlpR family DNA-binding transcription regulator [Acidimicrobiia bacterium]|nr:DeoR/GlpR family DNA-binding transcription regulator [Acidimicrobiia bacterium]